jgi:hypothetical protein
MTRTGKIARLPREIRDELNRRLERNLSGPQLTEWLNSLPEVNEVLQLQFHGKPISEQNLSEWRLGGFIEWQTRGELIDALRDSAHDAASLNDAAPLPTGRAVQILAALFLVTLNQWNGELDHPAFLKLKHLGALTRTLTALQRGEQTAAKAKAEPKELLRAPKVRASLKWDSAIARPQANSDQIKPNQTIETKFPPVPNRMHKSVQPATPSLPAPARIPSRPSGIQTSLSGSAVLDQLANPSKIPFSLAGIPGLSAAGIRKAPPVSPDSLMQRAG